MALTPFNTFLQWNCRSLNKRRFTLKHLVNIIQPVAICLKETFLINDKDLINLKTMFKDFNFYFHNRNRIGAANPRGGVAIMVHKDVPQKSLPLRSHLEAVAVDIIFKKKKVSICSLYLPPGVNFTVSSLTALTNEFAQHHILMGDFNAHNTLWGSERISYEGRKVAEFVNNSNIVLLNNGDPTRIQENSGNMSTIDLSLASPQLSLEIEWRVYTDPLGSDHFPIILSI